jgi:acyl-[acyl-carrier-protein] desaturase
VTGTIRDKLYRAYLDFLETAETKRRWNIFNDIPWDKIKISKVTEATALGVETFCAEELYVPDYSSKGLEMVRSTFGMAWFQTCWAYEESRHGLAFREYLTRSGLRSEAQFATFEENIFAKAWELQFETTRQMACYGALQEGATYTAYKAQKDLAHNAGDEVLETVFFLISRDEAAHSGFYRAAVEMELSQDRNGTIADLAYVLSNFKMPGDGLIPDYRQRLQASGVGISPRVFLEKVVWPLLTTLEITREEMKLALKRRAAA